jgi:hypothetical protein
MYQNIGQGASGTNQNIGGFADNFYWSSTESDESLALIEDFQFGTQQTESKDDSDRVRLSGLFNYLSIKPQPHYPTFAEEFKESKKNPD